MRELNKAALLRWPLPETDDAADKEGRGHVLVVAGSREIPGAALLAAVAAMRAGAGKLTIATAQSVASGLALTIPEARVIALPETDAGGLHKSGVATLVQCAKGSTAVLIGPGMMDASGSRPFVAALLKELRHVPVILDALAMDVLLDQNKFGQPVMRTPHAGEMAHLTGKSKGEVQAGAMAFTQGMAQQSTAVVVLKGATTVIAAPGNRPWCHTASNPGLAMSGSGDVLAGIMLGLAGRGAPLEQAAAWGVVLHAMAGKLLAERQGPVGFLARELLDEIPGLMRTADNPAWA